MEDNGDETLVVFMSYDADMYDDCAQQEFWVVINGIFFGGY